MSLEEIIAETKRRRKTITVFAPEPPDALEERFDTRHVTIAHEYVESAEDGFLVVSQDGEFLGSVGLDALRLVERPPVSSPGRSEDRKQNAEFRYLLELLDDATFSSFEPRQMLATAREIEDRAWRVGTGTLRTGFQSLSAMREQVPLYRKLANKGNLNIHVYGKPDWDPPEIRGITYHRTTNDDVNDTWLVAFDGGGNVLNKCALVAKERRPNDFFGFWTYDPVTVDRIIETVDVEAEDGS